MSQIDMLDSSVEKLFEIDQYRITKKIGTGSASTVYHAIQESTGQDVAIKVLKVDPVDSVELRKKKSARFKREMKLCTQIQHQNIVRVLDYGEVGDCVVYTVFEYLPGETLAKLLEREGALSLYRCKRLLGQILEGITVLHKSGVIHRDLKPENIMVLNTFSGENIKILDFGISTFAPNAAGNTMKVTMTSEFLGTPAYSAPEQLKGEPVTFKTDLFSWGLIAIECISGQAPYKERNVAWLVQKMLSASPIPIPTALSVHPLGALLCWVLQKDKQRRAGDAVQVLRRFNSIEFSDIPQMLGFLRQDFKNVKRSEINNELQTFSEIHQERKLLTFLSLNIKMHSADATIEDDVQDELYCDIVRTCKTIAESCGGFCPSDISDHVFVCFGYPVTIGNEAKKAAGAMLKIAHTIVKRSIILKSMKKVTVSYKAGIHTGLTTVQKMATGKEHIIGIVPSISGSLCLSAPDNSIVISKNVAKIISSNYDCIPYHTADCLNNSFLLLGEKQVESLKNIYNSECFVGREIECSCIHEYWNEALSVKGTGVLVVGDAGIGKSRLTAEILKERTSENIIELRCTEENSNNALFPVTNFFDKLIKVASEHESEKFETHLEEIISCSKCDKETLLSLYMQWVGLHSEKYPPLSIAPVKQKELLIGLLVRFFADYARSQNASILIEDLHWVDPTTYEFIRELLVLASHEKHFILMTSRPSFAHDWNTLIKELVLENLSDPDIKSLIETLSPVKLKENTVSEIIEKADGIPLFAVEMINSIEYANESKPGEEYNQVEIPDTLRELLTSRLDHSGLAKETAQLASVIGRQFDYTLLEKLSLRDEGTLLADLDQLVSIGILTVIHKPGVLCYLFNHALVRDAAYDSLTPEIKIGIHRQIAKILEEYYPEDIANTPGQVTSHWAAAHDYEKATHYGLMAAQRALTKSLLIEAQSFARKTLLYCKELTDETNKIEKELLLNQVLIHSMIATHGFASDDVRDLCNRSTELSQNLPGNSPLLFPVLWTVILYCQSKPDHSKLTGILDWAFPRYKESGFRNELAALYFSKGNYLFNQAKFEDAENCLCETEKLFIDNDGKFELVYGFDLKMSSLTLLCFLYTIQGKINKAQQSIEQALKYAYKSNSSKSISLALTYETGMWHYRNDKEKTAQCAQKLISYTENKELSTWNLIARILLAWANNDLKVINETYSLWEQFGLNVVSTYWNFVAAQIEFENGLVEKALKRVDFYIDYAKTKNEVFYLPELIRLKASCNLRINSVEQCKENLRDAIKVSSETGARLFLSRALLDFMNIDASECASLIKYNAFANNYLQESTEDDCNEKDQLQYLFKRSMTL